MSKTIKISRGLDINLKGKAEQVFGDVGMSNRYAVKPTDFAGLTPKMLVKVGQEVKAGDPLFYSKNDERIKFCSPVSGEVVEIRRGEKRVILEVVILADKEISYKSFNVKSPSQSSKEEIVQQMLDAGLWPFIVKRPYGVLANPDVAPKAIFISGFDSAPMAPAMDVMMNGNEAYFKAGIEALKKLTSGKVHIGLDKKGASVKAFEEVEGVEKTFFDGPHPAGNVGTQIHAIDPINKGDVVWTLRPQDVVVMGRFFNDANYNVERTVALTGSEVSNPRYYKMIQGANLEDLFSQEVSHENVRYISGNALTGSRISKDGFLGFFHNQITVLPEGDQPEFLGWALPGLNKFSLSKTFLSWMSPNKEYVLDTNAHGEERGFVVTGELEKVFPFDIYPMFLLKSIMVNDIEKMEQLGIYEIIEEDIALSEFVCTSKIDLQHIVSGGLRLMEKELG